MKKILFFGLVALISTASFAQQEEELNKFSNFYMFAEIGKSKDYNVAVYGGIALQLERNYFKIKAGIESDGVSKKEQQIIKDYYGNNPPEITSRGVESYSLMYGRSYQVFKICQLQFGSGLSLVQRSDKDLEFDKIKRDAEPERYIKKSTVGLPIEAKFTLQFKRRFAINTTYNLNVNPLKNFGGFSVGFGLGLF